MDGSRKAKAAQRNAGYPSLEVSKTRLEGPRQHDLAGGSQPTAGVGTAWVLWSLPTHAILLFYDCLL